MRRAAPPLLRSSVATWLSEGFETGDVLVVRRRVVLPAVDEDVEDDALLGGAGLADELVGGEDLAERPQLSLIVELDEGEIVAVAVDDALGTVEALAHAAGGKQKRDERGGERGDPGWDREVAHGSLSTVLFLRIA